MGSNYTAINKELTQYNIKLQEKSSLTKDFEKGRYEMEDVKRVWDQITTLASGMVLWQWLLLGAVILFLLKKPIQRIAKRQIRKVKKLVIHLIRLYFIGM
ncbi:uncharacterized membrane protein YjjP (DUF1212 family) [Paenibacillus sp. 1182]|uniref:hypothetical protein n=1 Tax=Paenibacillus sp. 1182 TaxID=2806565 RepID=UPI001B5AA2A6|nr:hypothetical protein [Paenibacillus sp. 1182]MBP1309245.1 uncharacterized membrane protein YjjP (DUF1212 family) [Paenibacillus sp. 1182]